MRENQLMRKTAIFAVMLALVAGVALAQSRDKKNDATRVLTGRVIDKQDNPLPNAVVYLTNTQSRATKTYIVGPDGAYHFPSLSPNIDYEVYAQFNGKKSDSRTVSQFESRPQIKRMPGPTLFWIF